MSSGTTLTVVIDAIAFVISVATSMFVSGTRWGRVETSLNDLQLDRVRKSDLEGISNRLSRLEGMFTLTLKSGER